MLSLEEMLMRLAVAILLGAVVGFERELVGKEAGVRTNVLVAAGASLFAISSIALPYLIAVPEGGLEHVMEIIERNGGPLRTVSNVVVGIGFLGAGIIVREGLKVKGLTTAASVWFVAALGTLAGIGLIELAAITAVSISLLLYVMRKMDFYRFIGKGERREEYERDEY